MKIDFEETVSYALARVSISFRTALERRMAEVGLHGGQTFILLELWREDGLRQIDLASRLSLSAPTINKMVKGLLEIKLVTRSRSDPDARSTRIFLTDDGREIRQQVEAQWLELEQNCVSELTETERLVLFEVLKKLRVTFTGGRNEEEEE